jgi:glycosyltransferase involved in cell wall biosynthesis
MKTGGTEGQLATLINGLDRERFEPHLMMLRPGSADIEPDCDTFHFPATRLRSLKGVKAIVNMATTLRRYEIRIVQTVFFDATCVGVIAAWLARVPVIISSRRDLGFWYTSSQLRMLKRLHKLSGHVLVNSESVRGIVSEKEGIPGEDAHVIPNGLDPEMFECDGEPVQIKAELGIEPDEPVDGIVANLNREVKRVDLFIEAAPTVVQTHPNTRFVIVGKGHLRQSLEEQCRDLGIADKVVFTGGRNDVHRLLHAFDVGVNCSDSEGFSNAVIEYMFAGIPVVASDVGGNAELVTGETDGLLFPCGDHDSLAHCINRLLADPDERCRFRDKARRTAFDQFTADRMVQRHMGYYDDLLAKAVGDNQGR